MSERSAIRRAVRRLPVVREEIDHAHHPLKVQQDTGLPVACKRGCAHCCHLLVTVSMVEALDLFFHAQQDPWLLRRVAQWSDSQALLLARGLTAKGWFAQGTRCMFLTDANDCAAYEVRPFACRTFMALETAEHCRPDAADPTVKRPNSDASFRYIYLHTERAAAESDLPVGVIPLPVAMQWASIVWNEGREALRRYLERAGIPAYDPLAHAAYWATRVEREELENR